MIELSNKCCEVFPVIVPERSSLKTANFYLIKHEHSLSLIDAGWNNEACWNALNDCLRLNGYTLTDLTEIILTHHHIDHIGLVNRIVSQHPIPVYTSPKSIPRLKRDQDFFAMRIEFFRNLYREMGCGGTGDKQIAYLNKVFWDNKNNFLQAEIREITEQHLFHFEIIETPGHAPDQLAFFDAKENWLFAGDLLIEHISSNALVEPDTSGNRIPTVSQHMNSLRKCMEMDVQLVFSGHGNLIENPNALILKRLARMESKDERLIELIQTGISTANELAVSFYKNIYHEQFSLVMSEIIGHLDYLEANGKISKELHHGVWHYLIEEK